MWRAASIGISCLIGIVVSSSVTAFATPSTDPDVLARRGSQIGGTGTDAPVVTLSEPRGGWTSSMQLTVAGSCSDTSSSPVEVNINGTRYFARTAGGLFRRKYPAAPGKNAITVQCRNAAGVGKATALVDAKISPIPLKVVLTSDTDGVYTDLHLYEPDGTHVYWAQTKSPSGGIFFLNQEEGSFDQPGYGPYLFVHPAAPVGVFRIDANYWPGGAVQHTLANLDIILNEGTPSEIRKRIRKPLARPDETATLAYVIVRPNRAPADVYVPSQDRDGVVPAEVKRYQEEVEPKIKDKEKLQSEEYALLSPQDEVAMRSSVVALALSQSARLSPAWEPSQRDCAGLVRFAYREALKTRSIEQQRNLGLSKSLALPVVSHSARRLFPFYPKVWEVSRDSENRVVYGPFADAETLLSRNFVARSFDPRDAQPGDLLAYRRDSSESGSVEGLGTYHLMVVTEPVRRAGVDGAVVYHTGASPGSVRVVPARDLYSSPDPTWIPAQANPHFLGVFQWKRFHPQV